MYQHGKTGSSKTIVVKFGGSSLADHERLLKAVVAVINEAKKGTRVAVVVSAMGKTTDVLMATAKNASNGKLEKKDLDDILSMGERTSIRIFSTALKTNGAESCYFDPIDSNWPIITDSAFQNANPILKDCEKNIRECVLPIMEKGIIPVVAGFLGQNQRWQNHHSWKRRKRHNSVRPRRSIRSDEIVLVTDARRHNVRRPENSFQP